MSSSTRLILLGKQGAGKGTQCSRLAAHYCVPHISTGDILRSAVAAGSPAGSALRRYLEAGELVPDEVVLEIIADRLGEEGAVGTGFVLDGFPRTTAQAEAFSEMLLPERLDLVIDLDVSTATVLARLASRRVCADCGETYSLQSPPKVNWTCDVCGGPVVQRHDDTEAAIQRRLDLYEAETAPLTDWYRERGLLEVVDGMGSADQVTTRLIDTIERHKLGSPR